MIARQREGGALLAQQREDAQSAQDKASREDRAALDGLRVELEGRVEAIGRELRASDAAAKEMLSRMQQGSKSAFGELVRAAPAPAKHKAAITKICMDCITARILLSCG